MTARRKAGRFSLRRRFPAHDRYDRQMRDLVVDANGAQLAATYSPAGSTALVALHGASAGTRDFFLYERLHKVLPPIGVGVVTFDRRGEGGSSGDPSRGRFDVQVDDALAVCAAL